MKTTVTTGSAHGFPEGAIVQITSERKAYTLWQLVKRPRVRYVTSFTATSFEMAERRMTWAEWRAAWLALLR